MKKKNLFDILALKETVNSNKYLQKLTPLKEEKIKVLKILDQLTELKENQLPDFWDSVADDMINDLTSSKIRNND